MGRTRVDVGNGGIADGIDVAKSVQEIVKHIEAGVWHTHVEGGASGVASSEVVGIGGEVVGICGPRAEIFAFCNGPQAEHEAKLHECESLIARRHPRQQTTTTTTTTNNNDNDQQRQQLLVVNNDNISMT